ncbi:MAG: hypothetical protein L6R38_004036 [Xanthoria sp. 2 TBL-2021]|nr:MAG: hypothetical protein L6R38_004036 [Xanthoria sp. 2 TBL-2021]
MEGQGWTRDTIPHEWRPRSANRTTAAMPPMSMPQPREAAHLHPNFPKQRLGTPLNPTSEVSHLISALDTESLHDSRNQRVEHTNDGARSFQSVEDRHDNRSSTSEKGGSDEGSGHGSWSGRSSGISSLGERSHHQALPQDSAGADANYGNEVKRGDGDTPGSHGATQGVDMTEGHQGPDKANNEAWSGREDFSARA